MTSPFATLSTRDLLPHIHATGGPVFEDDSKSGGRGSSGEVVKDAASSPTDGEVVEPAPSPTDGEEQKVDAESSSIPHNPVSSNNNLLQPSLSPSSNSSNGTQLPNDTYPNHLLDAFSQNLHHIDKDVKRCDRNYPYFTCRENLTKLCNVMCTYVWEHLNMGYVQGMCDLLAPLLVVFDNEPKAYSCFTLLMKCMAANFPNGGAMDTHFANMRSLIQILDPEMFELMHQNGDYTHFYFCYRWFLLDFKRELVYEDIFSVWEVIWSAQTVASSHFMLFIALALVQYYRAIILDKNMDFTDIIKFFNEVLLESMKLCILAFRTEISA